MESLANDPRFSRCWTRIDLDTIVQNYENARALCRSQLIPVLKADAYGMGAVRVARVLMARGAKLFAVATHAEAMELKNALPCDVLVMGLVGEAELDEAIARGVILAVFSLEYARAVSAHAKARPARVHFKVDTGLHRLGFSSLEELRAAAALPGLAMEGLFSHLALRDRAGDEAQYARLMEAKALLHPPMTHLVDSIGMVRYPQWQLDAARIGAWLYGVCPRRFERRELTRCPAVFCARVAQVHWVRAGECVGYDEEHPLRRDSAIATLAVGYADGYPRLNSVGEVEIHGRRAPVAGLVCMDQMMVDVTDIPGVRAGDVATLLGGSIGVDEYAQWADMNRNEALSRLNGRAPRVYIGGEEK